MPEEPKEIKVKVTVEHKPGVMSCFCIALLVILVQHQPRKLNPSENATC